MTFIRHYLIAFVVFTLIDLVWLLVISRQLYKNKIGHLMADTVNFPAAAAFYLLFIAALVFFVILPAADKPSAVLYALGAGAFFGLVAYATYDLTNLATLKGWPVSLTIIDLAWGSFVTGTTCAITTWISGKL